MTKGGRYLWGIKYIATKMKKNSVQDTEVEVAAEKDSTVEVIQMAAQVANILKGLSENAALDQFKESFDKAREIDPRSPSFCVGKPKTASFLIC